MLNLGGKSITILQSKDGTAKIFSVTTNRNLPAVLREKKAYISNSLQELPVGFGHYVFIGIDQDSFRAFSEQSDRTLLSSEYSYISEGDVLRISPEKGEFRVIYRASSNHNSLLLTERCDNYCLMCSQPPKKIDDGWIVKELKRAIPLIPANAREIGFTGGEPTLLKNDFLHLVDLCKVHLPKTALHVLSNGRSFASLSFSRSLADIAHHDLMLGIPLYSDVADMHDYVVQAKGAFDETIRGILNLKYCGLRVEIRVVLHRQTIPRLRNLAEFIARNLLFVDHVALMGLEMIGFTRANLDQLWIDPYDYRDELSEAVSTLSSYGINTSVYNQQLCLLNDDIYPFYRKSISDWKNEYADECVGCDKMSECGGFFSSGLKYGYSSHIKPFT